MRVIAAWPFYIQKLLCHQFTGRRGSTRRGSMITMAVRPAEGPGTPLRAIPYTLFGWFRTEMSCHPGNIKYSIVFEDECGLSKKFWSRKIDGKTNKSFCGPREKK